MVKQRESPKLPCKSEGELDRLSNLPGHIIDKILSHLSIRDAVRSSALSSKWRYKWTTLPYLVFDNPCLVVSSQDLTVIKNKLVSIVDHVLLLHCGPIQKFKLSHREIQGVCDIDRWILFLSRCSISEFILEIWKGHRYKLPSSLYLCQNLVHLELFNCLLKPPPVFEGFKNLKSMDLQHVTMDQCTFENLISSCPLLERLTLMNFDGFSDLKIHAPNLLFFDVGGVFKSVDFQNTFQLAIVSIGLYTNADCDNHFIFGSPGNLTKFFTHLPRIQRLEVQSYFLKYLAAGKIPSRLPTLCKDLSFLSLRINFNDTTESLAALCILRSSPNLQELEMLARPDDLTSPRAGVTGGVEDNKENFPFNQLCVVKIAGISCLKQELNFIKFILENSPVLEKMTVKPAALDSWEILRDLMKQLLSFRRASVRAQVLYLDP